jgi:dolichol-phosphate mannosyltransferase
VGDLTGVGFKILLDILSAPGPALIVREVPYNFRNREAGESKLDNKVLLEFVELLIARTVGRYVPTKFVMFSMVGSLGVIVHMTVLTALYGSGSVGFAAAQTVATIVAMTGNFLVNNFFTYHDRMLRGWRLVTGWLSFAAASMVGAVANVGVAVYLFSEVHAFWAVSAIAGIAVGVTWNYAITALYTWKKA